MLDPLSALALYERLKPVQTKRKILFVCVGNACRSQMAEGFARALAGKNWEVQSAGSHPAGFISQETIAVMREAGVDISGQSSKGLDQIPKQTYDVVVTMGCDPALCEKIPAENRYDWPIPDPMGHPLDTFRSVRELIRSHLLELFRELNLPPSRNP